LTDHPQDFGFALKPDDPRVVAAEKLLAMETDKFERVKALQGTRSASWQNSSAALSKAEAWLRHGMPSGVTLQDHDGAPPQLHKNETIIDGVERLRHRCRELKADLHRILSAPFPSAYAKQQMRAQIEALAMRGMPDVANLVEIDREIVWPMQSLQSEVYNAQPGATAFAQTPDALALTCWLHKDGVMDREINAEADDKAALSHEARQKAEAEVQADLLAVERDEAALVWQAQAQSLPCEHRSDCSPVAILGVTLVTTPRADGPPPTSAGLSWDLRR
jgi:hypothetical protein